MLFITRESLQHSFGSAPDRSKIDIDGLPAFLSYADVLAHVTTDCISLMHLFKTSTDEDVQKAYEIFSIDCAIHVLENVVGITHGEHERLVALTDFVKKYRLDCLADVRAMPKVKLQAMVNSLSRAYRNDARSGSSVQASRKMISCYYAVLTTCLVFGMYDILAEYELEGIPLHASMQSSLTPPPEITGRTTPVSSYLSDPLEQWLFSRLVDISAMDEFS